MTKCQDNVPEGCLGGIKRDTMKHTILTGLAILLALIFSGCKDTAGQHPPEKTKEAFEGVIVAVGDSLTAGLGVERDAGYPAQLQKRLEAEGLKYRVIDSGVSGETSSGTLSRLNWILSLKPDIVILETGANDGLRGVDPGLTRKNIEQIVAVLQEKKIITVLAGMQMVSNLGTGYTDPFRKLYREVAKESGVIFMPFFLEGVATDPALNISDGIHPNRQGYAKIVGNLFPYVVRAIEMHKKAR